MVKPSLKMSIFDLPAIETQITDEERENQIRELERSITEQQAKFDKLKEERMIMLKIHQSCLKLPNSYGSIIRLSRHRRKNLPHMSLKQTEMALRRGIWRHGNLYFY